MTSRLLLDAPGALVDSQGQLRIFVNGQVVAKGPTIPSHAQVWSKFASNSLKNREEKAVLAICPLDFRANRLYLIEF